MTDKDINHILHLLSTKLKTASARTKRGEEIYENADWGELYTQATAHAEEINVHAKGDFPSQLLADTFPNETTEEQEYRNKTFQPVTEPYWKKALRTLNRVWSEQNYSLKWNDNNAQEYFTRNLPLFHNVLLYFKSVVTAAKINDPNALLVVDFELPLRQLADGALEIDQGKELEPYAAIYPSHKVLMYESGDFALVMSEEKSEVQSGNATQKTGYVLYLYDRENIYRIEQRGKKSDWEFQYSIYYPHQLGYLPCWKLQGTPQQVIGEEVLYDSHFSPAIPYLNEALIIHSTLKSSISKIAYPIRAYYEQACNNASCQGGIVFNSDNTQSKCPTCSGTGRMRFSPFRDYVHELPTTTNNAGADQVTFPGLQYISPDSTILDFSKATIDDWIQKAFLFLNIDAVPGGMKKGLGENATATQTKIDREEQFVSLLDISNELFELMHKFIDAAYRLRYNKECPVVLNPPKTFDLSSASELTQELADARQYNIPDVAIGELTSDYVMQRFSQKSEIAAITKIVRYCDPLFTKSAADITAFQAAGNLQKWQVALHLFIYSYINEQMAREPAFLEKPLKEIKGVLEGMAKSNVTI